MREQNGAPIRRLREPTQKTIAIRSDRLAVRRAPDLSLSRAAWVQEPLQLRSRHDVRVAAVPVLLEVRGIERLEPGGDDDGADRLARLVAQDGPEVGELTFEADEGRLHAHVHTRVSPHLALDLRGELEAVVETVVVEEGERPRQPAHPAAELRGLLEEDRGVAQLAERRRHVHAGHSTAEDQYRAVHLATLPTARSLTAVPAPASSCRYAGRDDWGMPIRSSRGSTGTVWPCIPTTSYGSQPRSRPASCA